MIKLKKILTETNAERDVWKLDWLARRDAKLDDKGRVKAYHGTPSTNVPSIVKNGFNPRSYFSLKASYSKQIASTYQDTSDITVLEVNLPFDAIDMIAGDIFAIRRISFEETQ